MDWLPEAMNTLGDEIPNIDVTVSSQYSPLLADGLMRGKLDLAFMRPELHMSDLVYKAVMMGPLVVPAERSSLGIAQNYRNSGHCRRNLHRMSKTAPMLKAIVDDYLKRFGLNLRAQREIDNLGMATVLVASTRGVALLPAYAQNSLPWSVISLPLKGETPTIDLVIGYNKTNKSPILKLFQSKTDELISRVKNKVCTA
jgi:LysR family hca operon transcriptional activator